MATVCTSAQPSEIPTVGRYKFTVTVVDGQTTGTSTAAPINGRIKNVAANIPDCSGTTTVTVSLLDEDATTLYSKASVAENAKTHCVLTKDEEFNFAGMMRAKIVQTNAQSGSASTHYVIVYYAR